MVTELEGGRAGLLQRAREIAGPFTTCKQAVIAGDHDDWAEIQCALKGLSAASALLAALKPFADALGEWGDQPEQPDRATVWEHPIGMCVTIGDFRRAAIAMEAACGGNAEERSHAKHDSEGRKASLNPNPSNTQEHKGGDRG